MYVTFTTTPFFPSMIPDSSSSPFSCPSISYPYTAIGEASANGSKSLVMNKYKSTELKETIQEFKIHWSESGRDRKVWPEYTVVTDENLAGVLELLKLGVGRDVLEIRVGGAE